MPRRWLSPVVMMVATAAVSAVAPATTSAPALYVQAGRSGDCSQASPCGTFDAAVARATDGATVVVAAGSYGAQSVAAHSATNRFTNNVLVTPAAGAAVTVAYVDLYAQHVTVSGMATSGIYVRPGANSSGFDRMRVKGSAFLVGADNSFVTHSSITPNTDRDGLQIKASGSVSSPRGMRVVGNVIGPTSRGPAMGHVDCIQVMAGTDLTIAGNVLYRCASQGILVKNDVGGLVGPGLRIERNAIQLCPVKSSTCDGFDAINVMQAGAKVLHNTVVDGRLRFESAGSILVAGNIADNLGPCSAAADVRQNLYANTSCTGLGSTNRRGAARFADRTAQPPDLHLVAGSAGLGWGSSWVTAPNWTTSLDGVPVSATAADVGAYQRGGTPNPTASPTATPTATPTSTTPSGATRPEAWTASLNSRKPSAGHAITSAAGTLQVDVTWTPASGVSSSNLTVTVTDARGAVVVRATGDRTAHASAAVVAGTYTATVAARPGTISAAATVPTR